MKFAGRWRWRRSAVVALALALLPWCALLLAAAASPLPAEITHVREPSLRVFDRNGVLMHELRASDGRAAQPVQLQDVSPDLLTLLLASEDARFYWHPGIDPFALLRALAQRVRHGRVISGGSTLTQQLARQLIARPRTLLGKFREMALALRLEWAFDKRRILEEYLARVEFAPGRVGVEAASLAYFDKPAAKLDLAEAALLVALVRNPRYYEPRSHPERARARRDWLLARAIAAHAVTPERVRTALATPLQLQTSLRAAGAMHLVQALAQGQLVPELAHEKPAALRTTLDAGLQRDVETLAHAALPELDRVGASALAIVVVDNESGEVLAHVGSPDYFAAGALGGNDGTRALRQPGSLLKPFVYAAAFEQLGWDANTVLPDLELTLTTPNGAYHPKNYDGREHGPVRLRLALANSLNLPALYTAERLGPARLLEVLHRFGFASLEREAAHYGAALALGDGEVRLSEVAAAFAALARHGVYRPLRFVRDATLANGAALSLPESSSQRVLAPALAAELSDVLSDRAARTAMFGADSALDFPFPAAAKTGTSKGYRDNWAVAYSAQRTVAVWVGNFDGRPLVRSSGVSGAGPLLHSVMTRAMLGLAARPLFAEDEFVRGTVCALSGEAPTAACPARVSERFLPGHVPSKPCEWHPARPAGTEWYPQRYRAWAEQSGRPVAALQHTP